MRKLTCPTYAILRIWLYRKPPIFKGKAEYVRCAAWCIPRGVSSVRVFPWALGGASCKI